MEEGLTEAVTAAIQPSLVFTLLIAFFASYTLDDEGLWWYFISSLVGGIVAIVIAFLLAIPAASATVRCAWKSRHSLKFSHKVAHRTGMYAIFLACGLGIIATLFLFLCFEDWYGMDDPTRLFDVTQALWPFALTTAAVAVFFRVSGIIYGRTTNVGEVLIAHGNEYDCYIKHPASTTYNIGQLAGSLIGTTLDYYALFITSLVGCLCFCASSPEIQAMQGAPYYPIMYAGLVVNVCLLACVSINYLDLTDNSEDHYYVENVSRSILIITLVVLIPMTFLFHAFGLPETMTAGSTDFAVFQVSTEIQWHVLVYCSVFGLCAGFFICLLSEYFTSMNCPPSQKIAESSKKGLPVNLLKANSYSNVFAIITLAIMVIFISLCIHYAGGIGFAYGLMGLISFQIIAAVIQGAGGVAASAFRLTKLVEF